MAKNQQTLSKAAFKTTFPAAYDIMPSDGWNVRDLGEFLEQSHVVALGAKARARKAAAVAELARGAWCAPEA